MKRHDRQQRRVSIGMAIMVLPAATFAAGLDYEFSAGAAQSDNVARQPDNPQSETIAIAGLQFSLEEQTRRFEAELVGDLAYNEYLDDTFESEFIGNFAGHTRVNLVEDRLAWNVSDNFGQVIPDPFFPETPENRDHVNYLSTGLQGGIPVSRQMLLGLEANYALATYEDLPFDSTTVGLDAGLTRQIAEGNSLGLHARGAQVEYDDEAFAANDYDQVETFVRYEVSGARTQLAADGGYSTVESDATGELSGWLLRLNVARRLSSASMLSLDVAQEFSNSASAFASLQDGGTIDLGSAPGLQTAAPFVLQRADLRWNLTGRRTAFGLGAGLQKQEYEEQPTLDQRLTRFSADVGRDLTPNLYLRLDASYDQTEFEIPGTDYSGFYANATLSYRMTRHLVLNLTYNYQDRDSDLAAASYNENRIWLSLGYRRGAPVRELRELRDDSIDGGT